MSYIFDAKCNRCGSRSTVQMALKGLATSIEEMDLAQINANLLATDRCNCETNSNTEAKSRPTGNSPR